MKNKTCNYCGAQFNEKTEICCRKRAEDEMLSILQKNLKTPDKKLLLHLNKIFSSVKNKVNKKLDPEAFSLSEIIDKFIIIALKKQYLTGDKLKANKNDYKMVENIIKTKLKSYTIKDINELKKLCEQLWIVNAEIFCINDICGSNQDDRIAAAAARRMIEKIKERNKIKHSIASELKEQMFETKQFQ